MKAMRITLPIFVTLIVSACASYNTYTVRPGESLSGIASRHNMSVSELSRLNNISNPNHIRAGQKLKLRGGTKVKDSPRAANNRSASNYRATPSKPSDHRIQASNTYKDQPIPKMGGWTRPTQGQVVRSFNPNLPGHKGIQIAGHLNQPVVSANSGEVVYAGQGTGGAGQLVMVKHSNDVYSAYGYLSSVNVHEGQRVQARQQLGSMGKSSDGRTVLHFEVRVKGNAINPTRYVTF